MQRELKIAVRELVEYVLRSGDLAFEFLGASRPVEAIRAHQKIQRSRPATYQPEVAIAYAVETDRFRLSIGGRIDGVYTEPDHTIIEEIKTTSRDPAYFKKHENPVHWGQAKTYAYIYGHHHQLDELTIQLTYYQIDTGNYREIKHTYRFSELEIFFNDLVTRYLKWAATLVDWTDCRDASIQGLEFPFASYRPGQRQMIVQAFRTIRNGGQLLVQAATGIGKTMAVLYPAVKSLAENRDQKIFYLTARTTGQMVAEKAVAELRANGLKLKSLTLTAKDKICFCPQSACQPDECEFAKGHYDRINAAVEAIFKQEAFTREQVIDTARTFQVCPFE
ncbi:MAG: DEAD/DEAH box helicase, partial [Desulfobacterales bacterium]